MGWFRKFCLLFAPIVAVSLVAGSTAQGAMRDVCKSGCTFTSIQSAIVAALAGDTVRVHDGIYVESIDFLGKAIAVRSVNGPAATTIDAAGKGRVVNFASGEGPGSVLDGFTLTNGTADTGGGISCVSSSPVITNCIVSGNSADYGGGIYCQLSSPAITGCTITHNVAAVSGGGIHAYDTSTPVITGCTISGNSATGAPGFDGQGGGVYCYNAAPTIADSTISGNRAADAGGGFFGTASSSAVITNTTISGNSAGTDGGGICCLFSSPVLDRVTISGNDADFGGGIWLGVGSTPGITNATVTGNHASQSGGGLFCSSSSSAVAHSTFSGNSAGLGGGIFVGGTTATTVYNSILWGNAALSHNEILDYGGTITVAYSVVQGGFTGSNNTGTLVSDDPLFNDPRAAAEAPTSAGDYRLLTGSPCIDSGTANTTTYPALALPPLDRGGDPRPQLNRYDRGSDEFALLLNGSFEELAERVPVPWAARGLQIGDGLASGTARNGSRSFLITGATAVKSLTQALAVAGPAGDTFTLAGASMARKPAALGGFYGLEVQVFHTDGSKMSYQLGFTKRTHAWELKKKTFVAAKPYKRVVVSLVYSVQKGQAWFDDVMLSIRPARRP